MEARALVRAWLVPAAVFVLASLAWVLTDGLGVKRELRDHGVTVYATVRELVEVHPAKSGPCLAAVYAFTGADGRRQQGKVGCTETEKQRLRPGATVTVTYLPDAPATHRPGDFRGYSPWREFLVTLAVVSSGALLLLVAALGVGRLLRGGRPGRADPS